LIEPVEAFASDHFAASTRPRKMEMVTAVKILTIKITTISSTSEKALLFSIVSSSKRYANVISFLMLSNLYRPTHRTALSAFALVCQVVAGEIRVSVR